MLNDCHGGGVHYCTAIAYLQSSIIYTDSPLARIPVPESWYLHEPGYSDAAHRLRTSAYGGGYYLNQSNPAADAYFASYVKASYNDYDGLMVDDTGASMPSQFFGTGLASSEEISNGGELVAAHEQMAGSLTHVGGSPFLEVDNGLGANPWLSTPFPLLGHPGLVNGLIAEDVPEDNGVLINPAWAYPTMLDEMAYVDHTPSDFMVLLSYNYDGSAAARRMQAASVLLGYSRGHIVSWSDLEQDNRDLAVWPEEGIVPTRPRQSMRRPRGNGCLQGSGRVCTRGGHTQPRGRPRRLPPRVRQVLLPGPRLRALRRDRQHQRPRDQGQAPLADPVLPAPDHVRRRRRPVRRAAAAEGRAVPRRHTIVPAQDALLLALRG